jgi:hypothetical protein
MIDLDHGAILLLLHLRGRRSLGAGIRALPATAYGKKGKSQQDASWNVIHFQFSLVPMTAKFYGLGVIGWFSNECPIPELRNPLAREELKFDG